MRERFWHWRRHHYRSLLKWLWKKEYDGWDPTNGDIEIW